MAREGQLDGGREDPDAIVGVVGGRWEQERRLGQVRPAGEATKGLVVDPLRLVDDGDGIAAIRLVGEDVDLTKGSAHRASMPRPWPHGG